jgi:hypothetical protein
MDLGLTRNLQYLGLRLAATLAFSRLAGRAPDARHTDNLHRTLDEVAHALATVAPICVLKDGKAVPLELGLLLGGRFARGGAALVDAAGKEHADLVIQRRELDFAISILHNTSLGKALRSTQP